MTGIKFGASTLSWIPNWTADGGLYAIEKTAQAGFDLLEISLPPTLDFDARQVKKQLDKHGIEGRLTMILPKEYHLPTYPKKAETLLKAALDKVEEMDGHFLGGVLYAGIGVFTGAPRTTDEFTVLQDVLGEVVNYAQRKAITVALEPINRYETYVLTAAAEVLDLINQVGLPNIGLHLDTFHMNIEEPNFYQPVVDAGKHLKYIHMTESDRSMLGEGNVHWDDLFRGLADSQYTGELVLENFSSHLTELIGPTSLWRPSRYAPDELARGSLAFMRRKAAEFGLIPFRA